MADEVETFLGKCPLAKNGIWNIRPKKKTPEDEAEMERWKKKVIFYDQLLMFRQNLNKLECEVAMIQGDLFEMAKLFETEPFTESIEEESEEQ